jgi:membrane peptidoglycan carboxypeptidase
MKKSIFIIAALLVAITASAQERNVATAEQRAHTIADQMRRTLALDDDQYSKIYKAYLKQARRDDKRASQAMADNAATEQKVKQVLSPEQAKRWEQHKNNDVFDPLNGNFGKERIRIRQKGDPRHNRNMYIER